MEDPKGNGITIMWKEFLEGIFGIYLWSIVCKLNHMYVNHHHVLLNLYSYILYLNTHCSEEAFLLMVNIIVLE